MHNWRLCFARIARLGLALLLAFAAGVNIPAHANAGDTEADAVLGQADMTTAEPGAAADALETPRGLAIDPDSGRLYVADRENHRVLSWPSASDFNNGDAADVVLGQADFVSSGANAPDAEPTASNLNGPADVFLYVAGDDTPYLFVADTANNRVLRYASPTGAGQAADKVYGQPDLVSNLPNNDEEPDADSLWNPTGVAVDSAGNLFVADRSNNRVLVYFDAVSGDVTADRVFGQPDFVSNAANRGLGAGPDTLFSPFTMVIEPNGTVYIADSANNRVLQFGDPLAEDDYVADRVIGQCDSFFTNFKNFGSGTPSADTLDSPTGLALDSESNLYVADSLNHRVLAYQDPGDPSWDTTADMVIGQPDMMSNAANQENDDPTASTLNEPSGVWLDGADNLYVGDTRNNRVLRYDSPTIPGSGVSTSCGHLYMPLVLFSD